MIRKVPLAAALLIGLFVTASASATTYYIAANGSDSNNGTSTSSPWLHAPGMIGCSGTCASITPQPGDSFILRGGDTWHYSSGAGTPVGLPWNWTWSGSSSACQLNASVGTVVKTSCIYIGTSQSWYTGSSFTRPKFTFDNVPTTSRPSTCAYDDTGKTMFETRANTDLIIDNMEFYGACWQGNVFNGYVSASGNQVEVSNSYFHGFDYGSNSTADDFTGIIGSSTWTKYILCDHNVFDNSDGSLGTTNGQASGFAIQNTCTEISHNIFSHVSNGCICTPSSVHDNLFEFLYEPQGSQHGNIIEWNGPQAALGTLYFYNNVMHSTNEGEGVDIESTSGQAVYVFNNVSWHYRELYPGPVNNTDGTNCFMIDIASGSSAAVHFFNNTIDFPCQTRNITGGTALTTAENNHLIGASPLSSFLGGGGLTVTDAGYEIYESESTANSQGYTSSNNYAPTSTGDTTVGAGATLASLVCSTMSNATASAACRNGLAGVTYDAANHMAVDGQLVARNSAWDVGAYQFNSGSTANQPAAPTALTAVVQ